VVFLAGLIFYVLGALKCLLFKAGFSRDVLVNVT
jgi:hypothetical protein